MEAILKTLCETPAPSGSEAEIRAKLLSLLPDGEVWADVHGTLIYHKN